jgi:hypothetical protein
MSQVAESEPQRVERGGLGKHPNYAEGKIVFFPQSLPPAGHQDDRRQFRHGANGRRYTPSVYVQHSEISDEKCEGNASLSACAKGLDASD